MDLLPFFYFAALRALYGANFLDTVCLYLITLLELKGCTGKSKFFWTKFSKATTPKSQPPVVHVWNSSASVGAEKAKQKDGKSRTKHSRGLFLFWFWFGLLSSKNRSVFLSCGLHSQQPRTGVNLDLCQRDLIKLDMEGTGVSLGHRWKSVSNLQSKERKGNFQDSHPKSLVSARKAYRKLKKKFVNGIFGVLGNIGLQSKWKRDFSLVHSERTTGSSSGFRSGWRYMWVAVSQTQHSS